MNIALIGYGKMGKTIEAIALERGHTIALIIDANNLEDFTAENLQHCHLAIEFTGPHTAENNLNKCIEAGLPVVCGSTGWLNNFDSVKNRCLQANSALLYASNFSVGVNIFFEVNKKLASLMNFREEYNVTMEEIHHTEKKDAPSGTAITLAEQILENLPRKTSWINEETINPSALSITSRRIDPAPGTHKITYSSAVDDIEIIHTAHNRKGFALGAVLAAEFLQNKKGIYSMKDVLGI